MLAITIIKALFSESARNQLRGNLLEQCTTEKNEAGFSKLLSPVMKYGPGHEENKRHVQSVVDAMTTSLSAEKAFQIFSQATGELRNNIYLRDPCNKFYAFLADTLLATAQKIESPYKRAELLKDTMSSFPRAIMVDRLGGWSTIPGYLKIFDAQLDAIDEIAKADPLKAVQSYYMLLERTIYSSRTGDIGSQRSVYAEQAKRVLNGLNQTLAKIEPRSFLSFITAKNSFYREPQTKDESSWGAEDYKTLQYELAKFMTHVVSLDRAIDTKWNHYRDFKLKSYGDGYGREYIGTIKEIIKQTKYPSDSSKGDFSLRIARDAATAYHQLSITSHPTRDAVISAKEEGASLDVSRSIMSHFGPSFMLEVFQNPGFTPRQSRDATMRLRT